MTPKTKRIMWLAVALAVSAGGVFMVLRSFNEQLVFFFSPTELQQKIDQQEDTLLRRTIRIGGLVEAGSLQQGTDPLDLIFVITDMQQRVHVTYHGIPPQLFREGQGVVAEGQWNPEKKQFQARNLLAKHDENYMPPEVSKALKQSGQWQQNGSPSTTEPTAPSTPEAK